MSLFFFLMSINNAASGKTRITSDGTVRITSDGTTRVTAP